MASIFGTPGSDFVVGTPELDSFLGEAGDDTFVSEAGNDSISGNAGNDFLVGNSGNDFLNGNEGDDISYGDEGNDSLIGDIGNDNLYGGLGNDVLNGGVGNDILEGSTGRDVLSGGAGNDGFVIARGTGGRRLSQADIIADFGNGRDLLRLAGGLRVSNLRITQGTGRNRRDTIIRDRRSGEYLAVLRGVNRRRIKNRSFSAITLPTRETTPPVANGFQAPNITGGSNTQTFTVQFADNIAVNVLSLGNTNIRVTGPNNFNQLATLLSATPSGNGTVRTATYRISAPDNVWDSVDNGAYQVDLQTGQVFDTSANFAAATRLGSFTVNAPPLDSTVTLSAAPLTVAENSGIGIVYTFSRNNSINAPLSNSLTVNFSVGGTAVFGAGGNDYTQVGAASLNSTTGTIIFAPNATTATVRLTPVGDTVVEADETIALTIVPGPGYTAGTPGAATTTIANDDIEISLSASPAVTPEDSTAGLIYTFTRAGSLANPLAVNFNVSGSAIFGTGNDYTQAGAATYTGTTGTVTFAAGAATTTVRLTPINDAVVEPDRSATLTLASGTGYTISTPAAATGTILNDDSTVTIAATPVSAAENGGTSLLYTFTRTGFTEGSLTTNFSVTGAAAFGTDYTQSGAATFTGTTGTVTFTSSSSTATVTLVPTADSTFEPDEAVTLTLTSGSNYSLGAQSTATTTITNDDASVTVAVSPDSVLENSGTGLVYTFTRTGAVSTPLVMDFTVGGTGAFGATSDYTQTGATNFDGTTGQVLFAANATTTTVTVTPVSDTVVEPNKAVTFTVIPGTGYSVGTVGGAATGNLLNDDINVTLAVASTSVLEDSGTGLVYTFTRAGFTTNPLTVNFTVGGAATFGAGNDYTQSGASGFTGTTGSVTFAAGETTTVVTLNPLADGAIEPNEDVRLTLTSETGYNAVTTSAVSTTILNDDATITMAIAQPSVEEDSGTGIVYTFTRTGYLDRTLTVNLGVGGTATFGGASADYTQSGAATFTSTEGTVTFAPGEMTKTVTINSIADLVVIEPDETVILTLSAGADYTVGTATPLTGTVLNDDGVVRNTNDSGAGSLRQAIAAANNAASPANSTILFAPSLTGAIVLTTALPTIERSMIIDGPGASSLTVSGGDAVRILSVGNGASVTLKDLTIANGNATGSSGNDGGGLVNSGGNVTLQNMTFANNKGGSGAAISNRQGTIIVEASSFLNNQATSEGGGISNSGTVNVTNSDFFSNTAVIGAGIYTLTSSLTVDGSRFSGNVASFRGGGIFNEATTAITVQNSNFLNPQSNTPSAITGPFVGSNNQLP